MADDPISPDFTLEVNGGRYTFRKPGIRYLIEVGYRAADVRRRCAPVGGGMLPNDFALDMTAASMARYFAILELYLKSADATWPFSPGPKGEPIVDFDRFPPEMEQTAWDLGREFENEVTRFRAGGNPDKPPGDEQAVGGQPDPG